MKFLLKTYPILTLKSFKFSLSKPLQNLHPTVSTAILPPNHTALLYSTSHINAHQLLDEFPHPDLTSYNVSISSLNRAHRFDASIATFKSLLSSGLAPDQFTYGSVLSACVASHNLLFGRQVHSVVLRNGFISDGYILTGLVDLFAKNDRFDDAFRVFKEYRAHNVVSWNAVIAGGVRNGEGSIALELFREMVGGFCVPTGFTLSSVLSACAAVGNLEVGRGLHAWVLKCGVGDDVFVGTCIVDMYAKCGDIEAAVKEFSRMPVRNVVSWTSLISGFVQAEEADTAVEIFRDMIRIDMEINKYTLTTVLAACSLSLMVSEIIQIHCWTLKNGLFTDSTVKEAFINGYAKTGYLHRADRVFEEVGSKKDVGTWSAMISSLALSYSFRRSAVLFRSMLCEGLKPDEKCCSSILSIIDGIDFGRNIHSYTVKAGLVLHLLVGSALFTMYSKCGTIEDSYELFLQMPKKDAVSWTSMLSGFAAHGRAVEALTLFKGMVKEGIQPDEITLSAVLMSCYGCRFLMQGREIHGHALRYGFGNETLVGSSLISMYSKCNALLSAKTVFDHAPHKDQEMWSCLVSGYSTNGHNEAALFEFQQMLVAGFKLDHVTASSVLGVCAQTAKPILGRQVHAHGIKEGLMFHLTVNTALVMMYSKCGSVHDCRKAFDGIDHPDLITWTAMIDGYAQHGMGLEALEIFEAMKREGVQPDSVTFVGVLAACSHSGLVEDGFLHFDSMRSEYGIEPQLHHYACMVDLLGRSGRLKEAADFINRMLIEPNWLVWNTLLGACRVHGDAELGRVAAMKVLELEPCDPGSYVSVANITADVGDWEAVLRIRSSLKATGMTKEPGYSFL